MQLYPLDWLRDTRQLSHASKGVWIDILCIAWNEPQRGVYERINYMASNELGMPFCGRDEGCISAPKCAFHYILTELACVANVTFSNGHVTVVSRRMVREESSREKTRLRVAKYREPQLSNANVTPEKLEVRSQTSEVRRHKQTSKPTPTEALETEPPASDPAPLQVLETVPPTPKRMDGNALVRQLASGKRMSQPKSKPAEPKEYVLTTPLQKYLAGIKILQGYALDDRKWDSVYFKRYARAGSDMLKFFDDNWEAAIELSEKMVKEYKSKGLSWTVETLVRNAPASREKRAN